MGQGVRLRGVHMSASDELMALLAQADALLERAYYAADETDLSLAIGQARYLLAKAADET